MTTALRSFLRFARYRGDIKLDLAACVPSVASWSLSNLPKSLPPAQVEQVLANVRQRSTAVGQRDHAILLLLARLGLRGGEVGNLVLEDIDWENSRIAVRGKGDRVARLPMPAEVGKAIAAYLQNGRPRVPGERRLFLRVRAPLTGFKGQGSVGSVVKHALERAKIDSPRKGSHQFRHTLASTMLQKGSSLSEIGEVLRHRSPDTTAIYAKVDFLSLRALALPWPGGALVKGLQKAVEEYLSMRRALGFKLKNPARLLFDFVAFYEKQGAKPHHDSFGPAMGAIHSGKAGRMGTPVKLCSMFCPVLERY